jgi:hypothetical protein
MRFPSWLKTLPSEERLRAKAIYVFLFSRQPSVKNPAVFRELETLTAAAHWPEDGSLPPVSKSTAQKLGIDSPEWDGWRKFSELRIALRKIKEDKNMLQTAK